MEPRTRMQVTFNLHMIMTSYLFFTAKRCCRGGQRSSRSDSPITILQQCGSWVKNI